MKRSNKLAPRQMTLGCLPRVFVKLLALTAGEKDFLAARIIDSQELMGVLASFFGARHVTFGEPSGDNLASVLSATLDIPKAERIRFAEPFDRMLDELVRIGFFGNDGTNDPRRRHW